MWVKFGAHLLCTVVLFLWVHSYYRRKAEKCREASGLLALITKKNSEELKQYYSDACLHFKSITKLCKEKEIANSKMVVESKSKHEELL